MPEYLAPGVYVEEVPSGNKPIQAASTSTAGMVGMTARGPVNRPTLVTSLGAFNRTFGGKLNPLVYTEGRDALPFAAEGFFTNGGARVYVTRIVGPGATESELALLGQSAVAASPTVLAQALAGGTTLLLDDPGALAAGDTVLIRDGEASEMVEIDPAAFASRAAFGGGLANPFPAGSDVMPQTATPVAGALTADVAAGATQIVLTDATGIFAAQVLLLEDAGGVAGDHELVTVQAVDGPANTLTLAAPLARAHGAASVLNALADNGPAVQTTAAVAASAAPVFVEVPTGSLAAGMAVRLDDGGGTTELAVVTALPQVVSLTAPLAAAHPAGTALTPAEPVMTVHAMWPGGWGDSLRVSVSDAPLVETTTVGVAPNGSNTVTLSTAFGLFPGSVLNLGGTAVTVASADAETGIVTLTAPLDAEVGAGTAAVSREYTILVELIGPDDKVTESEVFTGVGLAGTHPRYIGRMIGTWNAATGTPSDSGGSMFIRIEDTSTAATRALHLVTGLGLRLDGGGDDIANVDDSTYIGTAAIDPDARTGMFALENVSDISICAVPGRPSVAVQKALIAHCNKMVYRFAVLDTPLGADIEAAKSHRQNFDSTRAAVYYPGLVVPNPFGADGDKITIPSSGHVLGIYARTDVARGVHKAPANEVVRGILEFEKVLSKGEQAILNPVAVNCFRDFRSEFRGLRLYGARVATSDPEWRYVNVRRLLLFIEQSLDTGLQWAVFEPNSEPLWASVKQSVTNFLTTVWRSGALEGTSPEEAFFVNIGYDITMTQADIDAGRMICEIGVAPVKPAEFVIVRISQKTREAAS
ncbi:phage tail sheath family protein [Meridianimarinicoccus sp. RP-17]|uniref:phage tail sheath family protein n=1 Tax=Meridianimarinicoccus zhengii TaxID=2056810 RepID=UPI000DADDB76|nr:phage tail sheath C-terminal domain-containing protein [Phycocomes zhengii]